MTRDLSRQSFLGVDSDKVLARTRVAIIGLCGGGSHIAQQLAHIGVGEFVLCDPDFVEESNLNRMVGAGFADAAAAHNKVEVIARVILTVNPRANIVNCVGPWQSSAILLRSTTTVFGCVDSFTERAQLEAMCRRFMIPYVDLGMDVTKTNCGHVISGQVILSMPGFPCMRCMGFLTESVLAEEARNYGAAGGKPQVVWPNGVLASTAVGLFMSLILPWQARQQIPCAYVEYDGNAHRVFPSNRLPTISEITCTHFTGGDDDLGDAFFGRRTGSVATS